MDWLLVLTVVVVLGIGFGMGWFARKAVERREEARTLNELVTYLHLKQTLAPIEPQEVPVGPEVQRARSAVADARETIVESLSHLQAGSGANDVLMRMAAACTRYLRVSGEDPLRYQFELMELRRSLADDLRILCDGRRDVRYRGPGGHGSEREMAVRKAASGDAVRPKGTSRSRR